MADQMTPNDIAASLPLADIHLSPVPGFWPLSWGWWLCIAAAVITLLVLIVKVRQHLIQQKARKEALRLLKNLNKPEQFNEINLLLRQTAMTYFSRQHVASLTGEQWLSFLDHQLAEKHRGFVALSSDWQQGLFSSHGVEQSAFNQCYQQAKLWLTKARLPANGQHQPVATEAADV